MKVKFWRIFARRWTRVYLKYLTLKIWKKCAVIRSSQARTEQMPYAVTVCIQAAGYSQNQIL